jgi:hypothetical protein
LWVTEIVNNLVAIVIVPVILIAIVIATVIVIAIVKVFNCNCKEF